jgi:hypothetical protein
VVSVYTGTSTATAVSCTAPVFMGAATTCPRSAVL